MADLSAEPVQRHDIVFLDRESLPPGVTLRRPAFLHDWREYPYTMADDIVARAAQATILIVNKVPLSRETIARLPRLRAIAVAATGTDNIDRAACDARGIAVANIRSYATRSVPEHTFALILALRRNILSYGQAVREGRWAAARQFCLFDYPIDDLAGSTLGIVGQGELGTAVGRIGAAFGMTVLFAARRDGSAARPGQVPFDDVLARSDVITLHCPLGPATRDLIGKHEFARMTRRPVLINVSRGGLVNEAALVAAVDRGQIAGAGLDVATVEPMPAHHPLMALADRPNVILTPHVAWASRDATQTLADQLIDNIEAFAARAPG